MALLITNRRYQFVYRILEHGVKRLSPVTQSFGLNIKHSLLKRNENYPGHHVLFRVIRLPGEMQIPDTSTHRFICFAVDSYSVELFSMICPDNSIESISAFISRVRSECAYKIHTLVCDTSVMHHEHMKYHHLIRICRKMGIRLKYDVNPDMSDKRVLSHVRASLYSFFEHQHKETDINEALNRFLNAYNWVEPNALLGEVTPGETLRAYFYPLKPSEKQINIL